MCRDPLQKNQPICREFFAEKVTHLGGTSSILNNGSTPPPGGYTQIKKKNVEFWKSRNVLTAGILFSRGNERMWSIPKIMLKGFAT